MQGKMVIKNFGVSGLALALLLTLSQSSHAATSTLAAGQRFKTLADVMDNIMRTKDSAWLRANLGEPDKKDTQYPGYVVWRWNTAHRSENTKREIPCVQNFALDTKGQLVGWSSDCAVNTPDKMYGEIAATAPIPKPVVPAGIAAATRANADKEISRSATFADYLATKVGKTEEQIHIWYKDVSSIDKLSNGKVVKTYYIEWSTGDVVISFDYDCKFSLSFLNGKVVGYDAGNCKDAWPEIVAGTFVHYRTPEAPWSTL
ncbi:hypothetical protein [Serratia sp. DD3]|uniref:hypothetical protein n=1 Tax=Serratia sp. DD3 TaxID=1410619 RepID=UPI0003C523B0|nr:hypothetical protein [Serratia sp. DD3]KEY58462.1 hypothetical protein SRDD_27090 [Serratia sp. DD3]